jgi:uncharacterized YigZ family protein
MRPRTNELRLDDERSGRLRHPSNPASFAMHGEEAYLVPSNALHRAEDKVRRSRFIASIGRAPDAERARAFIDAVRAEFPDATHHCWAFVAGAPGTTACIGLSDAGEPHGTAGRPVLNTLLHSGVGEIVAVVTRYFGGVKLGKGPLGRAYSGSVAKAIESLKTSERVVRIPVRITVAFSAGDSLFRLLDELGATGRKERFSGEVESVARVPVRELARLEREVSAMTSGKGRVELLREAVDRG